MRPSKPCSSSIQSLIGSWVCLDGTLRVAIGTNIYRSTNDGAVAVDGGPVVDFDEFFLAVGAFDPSRPQMVDGFYFWDSWDLSVLDVPEFDAAGNQIFLKQLVIGSVLSPATLVFISPDSPGISIHGPNEVTRFPPDSDAPVSGDPMDPGLPPADDFLLPGETARFDPWLIFAFSPNELILWDGVDRALRAVNGSDELEALVGPNEFLLLPQGGIGELPAGTLNRSGLNVATGLPLPPGQLPDGVYDFASWQIVVAGDELGLIGTLSPSITGLRRNFHTIAHNFTTPDGMPISGSIFEEGDDQPTLVDGSGPPPPALLEPGQEFAFGNWILLVFSDRLVVKAKNADRSVRVREQLFVASGTRQFVLESDGSVAEPPPGSLPPDASLPTVPPPDIEPINYEFFPRRPQRDLARSKCSISTWAVSREGRWSSGTTRWRVSPHSERTPANSFYSGRILSQSFSTASTELIP